MAATIPQIRQDGLKIWQQLTVSQKITVGILAIGTVAAIFGFVMFGQRSDYAPVFTKLSDSDAAAVVAKLKDDKVPYQLADNGSTVLVPSQNVDDIRLELASQGLPQGGTVGFELFDKTNFGLTDFAEKLNYQRGLEGELTRTISRLDAVDQARVHIVIPQPELYTDKANDATASVVLKLKPGKKLDPTQVQGVSHLVSSAVEGLKSENVTILDTYGNILNDNRTATGSSTIQATGNQLQVQQAYEKSIESNVTTMLDRTIGPGKAAVKASAVLDFDQNESTSETYNPDNRTSQLRSSQQVQEQYGGPSSGTGGIPGAGSNIPGTPSYGQVISGTGNLAYSRTESTNNYEVSKVTDKTSKAPGSVKRLSVAVLLDESMDDNQVQSINKAVAAAAGIDPNRGDVLTVTSLPFDRSYYNQQLQEMDTARQQDLYATIGKAVGVALASLLVLIIFRSLVKTVKGSSKKPLDEAMKSGDLEPTPEAQPAVASTSEKLRNDELRIPISVRNEDEKHKDAVRQQVVTIVRNKPDRVARLVQSWLNEE